MTAVAIGIRTYGATMDDDGNREYPVTTLIETAPSDGLLSVMRCPGLFRIGSPYNIKGEYDGWATCTPYMKVSIHQEKEGENPTVYRVDQKFSTRPRKRCQDTTPEDPLQEPQKVSGSFVKYTEERTYDRFGNPIRTSSYEIVRGSQVEFDANRPTVRIGQNVPSLGLAVFSQMMDTVNSAPLWGLTSRKIKLSNVSWEEKFYGVCSRYYTRTFEFDVRYDGFDRDLLDEGTKVLNGHWGDGTGTDDGSTGWILDDIDGGPPNANNPQHFTRYKDRNGENTRVILDGAGLPYDGTGTSGPGSIHVEGYGESNFLLLGIPSSF